VQTKVLGFISMDFDARGQLLVIYSTFVKYLKKIAIQWDSVSTSYTPQDSL
jgi:hypothetical protein